MIHHPFVAAVERKVSREQLAALFSPHATFNAPVLSDTIHDTATLLDFVELAARVASPPVHIGVHEWPAYISGLGRHDR
jgi:hypothetical protein